MTTGDAKHYAITSVIAVALAAGVSFGVLKFHPPTVLVAPGGKALPNSLGSLSQEEVDSLTAILKKATPKPVAIFCGGAWCSDMALDFDNAFESSHWESGIETPLVDTNVGVSVGPDDEDGKVLAAAIESATGGRISPHMIGANVLGGRLVLVLSRKKP